MDWKKHWKWIVGIVVAIIVVILIIVVVVVVIEDSASSSNEPALPFTEFKDTGKYGNLSQYQIDALNQHNEYRAKHRSPPLEMDEKLNDIGVRCAEYYANLGTIDHSCPFKSWNGQEAGENLATSFKGASDSTYALDAGKRWYDEIKLYKFSSPGFSMDTGHFTAVVWKSSTKFGIGVAKKGNMGYVAGMYIEHPNLVGAFEENVLPPSA